MADLKTLILKLIYKTEDNFCFLCLKNYNQDMLINFVDDIELSNAKSLSIIDLVACVLGEEFKQTICLLHWICSNCTRSLVSCYNFIEACQENSKKIHEIVKNMNNFFKKRNNDLDCNPTYINIVTEGSNIDYNLSNTYCQVLQTFNNSSEDISKYDINQESVQGVESSIKNIKNRKPIKANDLRCKDDKSRYKCKICLQTYSRGQNLMKHYYRAHAPKKYKCNVCQKKYGTLLMLKDHINTSHSTAVCSHCGKVYNNKLSLKNHEKSHIVRHICPHCSKIYKTNISFKRHVETLCGKNNKLKVEEKFKCDHCGKQYVQKSALRVHIQFEHGNWKSYVCEWCNKKCNSISKWKEHIVTHTKEKNFGCEICGGTFVTKKSLLYHTRTHTGEKPYKCSYCDKSFLSASRRSTHIKYHHKPAIEECDVCNKKFKGKTYMLKHRKRHFDPNSRLHSGIE